MGPNGKNSKSQKSSHINSCVQDSTWEAGEAFQLDHDPGVAAWVKNDHLGFEILYVYRGVVRKYRPDQQDKMELLGLERSILKALTAGTFMWFLNNKPKEGTNKQTFVERV